MRKKRESVLGEGYEAEEEAEDPAEQEGVKASRCCRGRYGVGGARANCDCSPALCRLSRCFSAGPFLKVRARLEAHDDLPAGRHGDLGGASS
jgi:hypothetical protein